MIADRKINLVLQCAGKESNIDGEKMNKLQIYSKNKETMSTSFLMSKKKNRETACVFSHRTSSLKEFFFKSILKKTHKEYLKCEYHNALLFTDLQIQGPKIPLSYVQVLF